MTFLKTALSALKEVYLMADTKQVVNVVALVLLIVGGLNWGLVGLFGFDLVEFLLGAVPFLQKLVYVLVGLAAVYEAFVAFKK